MFSTSSNTSQVQAGPDLEEVTTEALGFLSLAGETKIRLLPSPWPSDNLPLPTSSLFSIASQNELLAAAGPDTLVIASTSAVREAYTRDGYIANNVKGFDPQLKISVPRISHVAFSSNEIYLIICADEGGGLAIYNPQALKRGKTESEFQIATNGIKIRALVPNPAPENGHLIAIVLANGQLMLANLQTREFVNGKNGLVLRDGVSCVSWSTKGKQLVAGLGTGAATQLTPEGIVKADIPRAPQLEHDEHVSTISWLNNDTFCIVYTPTTFSSEKAPDSIMMLCTRQKNTSNFAFQKLPEVCSAFGMNRAPPHHFLSRMREFPPNLADVLIFSSTASGDVGLIACSNLPLSSDPAAANTANKYTNVTMASDARRAQLPVTEKMTNDTFDTSPIGMALDFSSKSIVKRPIPGEEIDATKTPLPCLMILNNEGLLSSWWFVYSDSVRQGQTYPGLATISNNQQMQGMPSIGNNQSSPFGALSQPQNGFGAPSSLGGNAFGQSATPTFGNVSTSGLSLGSSTFGSASSLGASKSAWNSVKINTDINNQSASPAFAKPTFGNATPLISTGSPFGAAGAIGKSTSPWASGHQQRKSGSDNSASPFANTSSTSPFATFGQQSSSKQKPVSAFSNTSSVSPFASAKPADSTSLFGATSSSNKTPGLPTQPSFGSTVTIGSSMESSFGVPSPLGSKSTWGTPSLSNNTSALSGQQSNRPGSSIVEADMTSDTMDSDDVKAESSLPVKEEKVGEDTPKNVFGSSTSEFQLKSSFTPDKSEKMESKPDGNNLFGNSFGNILNEVGDKNPKATPEAKAEAAVINVNEDAKKDKNPQAAPVTVGEDAKKDKTLIATTKVKTEAASVTLSEDTKKDKNSKVLPEVKTEAASVAGNKDAKKNETERLEPNVSNKADKIVEVGKQEDQTTQLEVSIEQSSSKPSAESKSPKLEQQPEPAPLPPSPKIEKKEFSPAGTPPIDLGADGSSPLSSTKSSDKSAPVTVALPEPAPLPPDFAPKQTWESPSPLPRSRSPPKSPEITSPALSIPAATPSAFTVAASDTYSATKPPVFFAQPGDVEQSPRSPSPVRRSRTNMGQRSLSSPSPPRQASGQASTTPMMPPPPMKGILLNGNRVLPKPNFLAPSRLTSLSEAEIPEVEDLDDSDQKIQQELNSHIEATTDLAPFLAHQDYVGKLSGQGIPVQIERIYRDISSMIDTLGLNARSLEAFIKGHTELSRDQGRDRGDLEFPSSWTLQEVDDLHLVQKELSDRLEAGRPLGIEQRVSELRVMQQELSKLRTRHHDMQLIVYEHQHPNEEKNRPKSLSNEQSSILIDLRKDFQTLQKLIGQAEDAVALLKARLASVQASEGRPGSQGVGKVPTVEAVLNTIGKMTRMIEQRSGDLDVLESQIRMIRGRKRPTSSGFGASTLDEALGKMSLGNSFSSAKDDNIFSTPPSSRKKNALNGTYAMSFSSESSDDEGKFHQQGGLDKSLVSSMSNMRLGQANGLEERMRAMVAQKERRARIMALVKHRVCNRGTRVTVLGES